jgi:hypothetical protein
MHHTVFIISHFINYLKNMTIVKPYGFEVKKNKNKNEKEH